MKKFILILSIIIFPYSVAFILYCIFSGLFMENIFKNNAYLCFLLLLIIWFISLIFAISFLVLSLIKKWDFIKISQINMIIKLISIPAYLFIFIIGSACIFTIFTFGISIILMILDIMGIILSGLIGISAVKLCYDNNVIAKKELLIYSISQFIFCIDVISSIALFRKSKNYNIS